VYKGVLLARSYDVASVVVRPSDIDVVLTWMKNSAVRAATVAGYPHGSTTAGAKLFEVRDLLRRGAQEIHAVLNVGQMVSRHFEYVETELLQMADSCRDDGAVFKIILRNDLLNDEHKIIACRMAKRIRAAFVSAAAAPNDLALLKTHCGDKVSIEITGVTTLEQALELTEAGVARIGTTHTETILDAWKARIEEMKRAATASESPSESSGADRG
jgi:deoxyribose-phosphate aldolase